MRRKLAALGVILGALLLAWGLPKVKPIHPNVVHQHLSYPKENPEITGFDASGNLTSHLPLVILKTGGQMIPGGDMPTDEELYCQFAVIDNDDHVNHSADAPTLTGRIALNIRGRSSRYFPKKQYALRTVDEAGLPIKTSLLGMPIGSKWVLNGSYIDHSQLRNYIMYNISGEIMDYAPRCRLCEVFLETTDGKLEYQGLYTLIEKPTEDKQRLNLNRYDAKFAETSFILQMNKDTDDYRIEHLNPDGINPYPFNLEYPDADEITDASLQYIKSEMLKFEKSLYDASFTGNWKSVEAQIDMDSFVDYYIINEFFQNYDAGLRSTYLYRNLGSKIVMGPVWDFDSAFNNFEGVDLDIDIFSLKGAIYYDYLTKNSKFANQCIQRYQALRKTILSDAYLLDYIDASAAYLGSAAQRNCDLWYRLEPGIFEQDIEKMKTFVLERGKWMDENFEERTKIAK